jgi:hypothetical protein
MCFGIMRWTGHVARKRERRGMHVGCWCENQNERDPLGRPRRRSVDNIKLDLRDIGWNGVDWIDMAENRDQWRDLVYTVLNLRVP